MFWKFWTLGKLGWCLSTMWKVALLYPAIDLLSHKQTFSLCDGRSNAYTYVLKFVSTSNRKSSRHLKKGRESGITRIAFLDGLGFVFYPPSSPPPNIIHDLSLLHLRTKPLSQKKILRTKKRDQFHSLLIFGALPTYPDGKNQKGLYVFGHRCNGNFGRSLFMLYKQSLKMFPDAPGNRESDIRPAFRTQTS